MKTKTTHTEGPWKTGRALNNTGSVRIVHKDHLTLAWASCEDVDGITRDEAMANARLIAAAPDLLEAARYVLMVRNALSGYTQSELDHALDKLRAAAIKAEGMKP